MDFDKLNSGKIKNSMETETRAATKPGDVGLKTISIDRSFCWVSLVICYGLRNILAFYGNRNYIILLTRAHHFVCDIRIITRKNLVNCVGSVLSTVRSLRTVTV